MKTRVKLVLGAMFAAAAVMAATQSLHEQPWVKQDGQLESCYSDREVKLLMKSNHWTEEEVRTILDLACLFSNRSHKAVSTKEK